MIHHVSSGTARLAILVFLIVFASFAPLAVLNLRHEFGWLSEKSLRKRAKRDPGEPDVHQQQEAADELAYRMARGAGANRLIVALGQVIPLAFIVYHYFGTSGFAEFVESSTPYVLILYLFAMFCAPLSPEVYDSLEGAPGRYTRARAWLRIRRAAARYRRNQPRHESRFRRDLKPEPTPHKHGKRFRGDRKPGNGHYWTARR